jgi:predicted O-linked N-acetylglucosamine transferase (SPINDLY family)
LGSTGISALESSGTLGGNNGLTDELGTLAGLIQAGNLAQANLYFDALGNVGDLSADLQRLGGELKLYLGEPRQALKLFTAYLGQRASDAAAWCQAAKAMLMMEQGEVAMQALRMASSLAPDSPDIWHAYAVAAFGLNRPDDALVAIRKACELAPNISQHGMLYAQLMAQIEPGEDRGLRYFVEWARRHADPLMDDAKAFAGLRDPDKRLRVGYVSGDMRDHAVAYLIEPVLAKHNAEAFELFVFSNGPEDDTTEVLRRHVEHWFDVRTWTDEYLAEQVRLLAIDILVDLSGTSDRNRLLAFARKPAPVQVTWFGEMNSTGMRAMDYRLTDGNVDPEGKNERFYTEQLFRLKSMVAFRPSPAAPDVTDPPMLKTDAITFGSFNKVDRISDFDLVLWHSVLLALPNSSLKVFGFPVDNANYAQGFLARATAAGLPVERIELIPRLPLEDFLAQGSVVDIAFDTTPISGGTTTMHLLWMGVPILSMMRDGSSIERATPSTLSGLGLNEFLAETPDDFVTKAQALASDADRLCEFRQTIRARMSASMLMDEAFVTRDLEKAFRLMWLNYLRGDRGYVHTDCVAESHIPQNAGVSTMDA